VVALAQGLGMNALLAGRTEQGPREVVLEPLGVRYASERLELG
jgi:phosphoribosylformylglycinamidine cyclo-ligase